MLSLLTFLIEYNIAELTMRNIATITNRILVHGKVKPYSNEFISAQYINLP